MYYARHSDRPLDRAQLPSYLRALSNWHDRFVNPKACAQAFLSQAGITINGSRPWDLIVRDDRLYGRLLRAGSIGLGESYMDGWWECAKLDELLCHILTARLDAYNGLGWRHAINRIANYISNPQSRSRSKAVAERHYDLGNDLYRCMLDDRMVYTCGRWNHASSLTQAQEHKLHIVCEKLALEPGMHLLDIGCGWGSLAEFAARQYGARVTGVTISEAQLALARERCAGLPIDLRLQDYRSIKGKFDRIASLGMFEHVGHKNYREYFETVFRMLAPEGLFYLSTIGSPSAAPEIDPWIEKHIFPNYQIPTRKHIMDSICGLFSIESNDNWAADYERTVMAWFTNFDNNWGQLRPSYGDRFYRMWKYYLMSAAATFRSRNSDAWQIVLSPT